MLSDDQLDRYARHIVLKEIGGAGQVALLKSRVLVVGAGGLGVPVIAYLAAAGVGHLTLIDPDTVSLSNLQRQILYCQNDIGRPKVACAADFVAARNSDCLISAQHRSLKEDDGALFNEADLVLDCTDNFATRLMINDMAVAAGKPLVSAAIAGFEGQIATFRPHDGPDNPCYRCFVPDIPPENEQQTCSNTGVLGTVAGSVGTIQAQEAIKELLGIGNSLVGHLLILDSLHNRQRLVSLPRDPACRCCGTLDRKVA